METSAHQHGSDDKSSRLAWRGNCPDVDVAPDFEPIELSNVQAHRRRDRCAPLTILLLCDDRHPANVVKDHIEAFSRYSRHRFVRFNPMGGRRLHGINSSSFDAILIHYSIFILGDHFLPKPTADFVRQFQGLKIQFIQDEYRRINEMVDRMADLSIHILFSALHSDNVARVYHHAHLGKVVKYGTLPGYVPGYLLDLDPLPIAARPLDVIYRARPIPFWLGRHGQQKQEIARGFTAAALASGLKVNVSDKNEDRIYGAGWVDFVKSAKVTLGTEGGSSVFDFTGDLQRNVERYVKDNPHADFDEVHARFLTDHDGKIVHGAITPRIFEAIALRTALVLFPGNYRGLLQPWRHYIPLERDFSNIEQVIGYIKDDKYLQDLVDRTYQEIVVSGHYTKEDFIRAFDAGLDRGLALLAACNLETHPNMPPHRYRGVPRFWEAKLRVAYCAWRNDSKNLQGQISDGAMRGRWGPFFWCVRNPRSAAIRLRHHLGQYWAGLIRRYHSSKGRIDARESKR